MNNSASGNGFCRRAVAVTNGRVALHHGDDTIGVLRVAAQAVTSEGVDQLEILTRQSNSD